MSARDGAEVVRVRIEADEFVRTEGCQAARDDDQEDRGDRVEEDDRPTL